MALAPAAHSQPVSLATTRPGSITSGFPVQRQAGHLAYTTASLPHSLPPRLAYTQGAALAQAQAAQAQQAAAAAAGQGGAPGSR